MSSTDPRAALGALFDAVIVPMAARAEAEGRAPLLSKPDASVESYYVRRPQPAMRREDFVTPSCEGFEDFERRLAAHWRALGRFELADASTRFTEAARAVYALREDASGEVSPFVYVMF